MKYLRAALYRSPSSFCRSHVPLFWSFQVSLSTVAAAVSTSYKDVQERKSQVWKQVCLRETSVSRGVVEMKRPKWNSVPCLELRTRGPCGSAACQLLQLPDNPVGSVGAARVCDARFLAIGCILSSQAGAHTNLTLARILGSAHKKEAPSQTVFWVLLSMGCLWDRPERGIPKAM